MELAPSLPYRKDVSVRKYFLSLAETCITAILTESMRCDEKDCDIVYIYYRSGAVPMIFHLILPN